MPRERRRERLSTPPAPKPPPPSPVEPTAPAQTPHDGLFHFTFSQVEHAAPALEAVLPASLAAQIDFSTLRVERGHFVDPKLHERRADLLYSATIGRREAPNGPDAMLAIMEYLHSVTRKDRAEVVMAMREALGADVADRIIHVKEFIREEGREEGQQEGQQRTLRRLLELRFGALPEWALARVNEASVEELDAMTERLLGAPSLEAVLGKEKARQAGKSRTASAPAPKRKTPRKGR